MAANTPLLCRRTSFRSQRGCLTANHITLSLSSRVQCLYTVYSVVLKSRFCSVVGEAIIFKSSPTNLNNMAVQMALRAPAKVPQSVFLVRAQVPFLPLLHQAKHGHQGFLWSGTALSLCFLAFRLCVKLRAFRKLYVDDYLVVLAWLIKLTTSILWQIKLPAMYEQYAVQSGQKPITPGFFERDAVFLRYIVPLNILFYSCLWAVKISFLVFFRRLGSNVRNQKIWWWFVLILTILAWVACIADIRYQCALGSIEHILSMSSPSKSL